MLQNRKTIKYSNRLFLVMIYQRKTEKSVKNIIALETKRTPFIG